MNTAMVFRGLLRGNQTDANSARGSGNEKGCLKRCLQRKRKNLILAILLAQIFANSKKVKKQAISEEIACFPQEKVVRQKGFEPPTFWFVAKHSIQLSYWRKLLTCGVPREGGYAFRSQTLYPAELLAHTQFRLPYKNTTAPRYCQHFFQFPSTKLSRGIPTGQLRTKRPQPSVLQPLLLQIADARFPMPHKPSP